MQQLNQSSVRSGMPKGYTLPQGGTVAHQSGGTSKGAAVNKDEIRFWSKINKDGPTHPYDPELGKCWVWTAPTNKKRNGYGYAFVDRKRIGAHRYSFLLSGRMIEVGKQVCHSCDNSVCVNPAHLFLGTKFDNMQDCENKGRTGTAWKVNFFAHRAYKLNAEKVKLIRGSWRNHSDTKPLSESLNIHPDTVRKVVKRQLWKGIE